MATLQPAMVRSITAASSLASPGGRYPASMSKRTEAPASMTRRFPFAFSAR